MGVGTLISGETASPLRKEAGGVNSLVAVYMHWDDGLCISLNLVTPPRDAWILAEQQAGDQDGAPGMILC